jgi:hypothetical protein
VARGRLQCVGSSLHLKQKFGAGYTITVGTAENQVQRVQEFFENNLKGAKLTSAPLAGYLHFAVDRQSDKELVPFFKELEKNSAVLFFYHSPPLGKNILFVETFLGKIFH